MHSNFVIVLGRMTIQTELQVSPSIFLGEYSRTNAYPRLI